MIHAGDFCLSQFMVDMLLHAGDFCLSQFMVDT